MLRRLGQQGYRAESPSLVSNASITLSHTDPKNIELALVRFFLTCKLDQRTFKDNYHTYAILVAGRRINPEPHHVRFRIYERGREVRRACKRAQDRRKAGSRHGRRQHLQKGLSISS